MTGSRLRRSPAAIQVACEDAKLHELVAERNLKSRAKTVPLYVAVWAALDINASGVLQRRIFRPVVLL